MQRPMDQALRIGIVCHPTIGGSGVIATEIGLGMARRGHHVHFICSAIPAHLLPHLSGPLAATIGFHRVEAPDYPLPNLGLYPMALASRLAELGTELSLDLIHVHYAVPHALSALLSRQILWAQGRRPPRLVTTLHGTDVTQLGSDPRLVAVNRHALLGCDGLTTPSEFLKRAARDLLVLPPSMAIEVIPNFIDTTKLCPGPPRVADPGAPLVLCHSSNFRPLKRIEHVIQILAKVRGRFPARLVLIGDGPERPRLQALVDELGLSDSVQFLGMQHDVTAVLQGSDVFLLPSDTEGFGLAALEAQSCGVPVIASRVGGIPEVVTDGVTGLLCAPGDVEGMAAAVLRLAEDPELRRRLAGAARQDALARWQQAPRMAAYEVYYRRIVAGGP